MSDFALSASQDNDDDAKPARAAKGAPYEVRWEVVAETMGMVPAQIIAGRLQSDGFPVRVWQESAGIGFGLTVGALGTAYVAVPAEMAEEALALLEDEVEPPVE